MLNANSEAIVDIGMVRISLAIRCKVGYLGPLDFHHAKISNPKFLALDHPQDNAPTQI